MSTAVVYKLPASSTMLVWSPKAGEAATVCKCGTQAHKHANKANATRVTGAMVVSGGETRGSHVRLTADSARSPEIRNDRHGHLTPYVPNVFEHQNAQFAATRCWTASAGCGSTNMLGTWWNGVELNGTDSRSCDILTLQKTKHARPSTFTHRPRSLCPACRCLQRPPRWTVPAWHCCPPPPPPRQTHPGSARTQWVRLPRTHTRLA